ncbi:uncharacterized protein PHACADRAFT_188757 [Phanerochaete carnosa HHB-10118-sp]|uniref:AB hydrolase-1 domain-containing protein n=1 Tax=Phanerochaete carnosa (strain HHB-10118-sp) TaxID=650164 RepID=K5UJG9_PHACS|nr:uncharacterized protein PHACADRAFT_188757 [Phanerochaete carnosa HHB-10118-sp]EKM49711.1 hypothetical protein PHACADRAFT_188757 [Phanerochaete carnosa HHB-10118-sp]
MQQIVVDDQETKLSYIDSGVPASKSGNNYTTIFAIHGSVFTNHVFEKLMAAAAEHNIRIVAMNRREYPGSTPLSPSDIQILSSGTDDEKAAFLRARGLEIATFACRFAQQYDIPRISEDGKTGGFVIFGWSFGCSIAHPAVAHFDALPPPSKQYFSTNLRGLILLEPPTVTLGTPMPPKAWSPHIDTTVPQELRDPFFGHWISSYFKHGDISTRDLDVLSYIVPGTFRAPSIYSMSEEQLAKMTYDPPAQTSDLPFMIFCSAAANASYRKAFFDKDVRAALPGMMVAVIMGDATSALSLAAYFAVQNDDDALGGGFVRFKELHGTNHFVHWDEPELILKTVMACIE